MRAHNDRKKGTYRDALRRRCFWAAGRTSESDRATPAEHCKGCSSPLVLPLLRSRSQPPRPSFPLHTHTHTRARAHTHTHSVNVCVCVCVFTDTYIRIHNTYKYIDTACASARARAHTYTRAHTHIYTCAHTHIYHTHAAPMYMHTCVLPKHAYTNTHGAGGGEGERRSSREDGVTPHTKHTHTDIRTYLSSSHR